MSDFFDELNKSIEKGKESHLKYINFFKDQGKKEDTPDEKSEIKDA